MTHLHAAEGRSSSAFFMRNEEGVRRPLGQRPIGMVEQLQGLVASVGDSGNDFEVLDAINSRGAADTDGKSGGCAHRNRGGD